VRTELRLLSLGTGADPDLLDLAELPAEVRQLLFHPSGGSLYVSGADGSLRAYVIGPQNRLELVEDRPDAGGTSPVSGFIESSSSMAVTVRAVTPRL
jgi:hypothetical protein